MAAPARPVAGAPIESVWGDAAHDVAVQKVGCVAFGGATVAPGGLLNLSAAGGRLSMVDAASRWIVIPVAGLWTVRAVIFGTGTAAGGLYQVGLNVDSAGYSGCSWPCAGAAQARGTLDITRMFVAGAKVQFLAGAQVGSGASAYAIDQATVTLESLELV